MGKQRCCKTDELRSLQPYFEAVDKLPLITREEEAELLRLYQETGEARYKHRLVEAHQRWVVKIAKRYMYHDVPLSDLIQEGNLGLCYAIDAYKKEKNCRLLTFAMFEMLKHIHQCIFKSQSIVVSSRSRNSPNNDQSLDVSRHEHTTGDQRSPYESFVDLGNSSLTPEEELLAAAKNLRLKLATDEALQLLSPKQLTIIQKRFLLDENLTLQAIADELGDVSREGVRLAQKAALKKLRLSLKRSVPDLAMDVSVKKRKRIWVNAKHAKPNSKRKKDRAENMKQIFAVGERFTIHSASIKTGWSYRITASFLYCLHRKAPEVLARDRSTHPTTFWFIS